jgi:hypothetical protein
MPSLIVPPFLASLIGRIGAAVPARVRTTFRELLMGTAATKGGRERTHFLTAG